MSEIEAYLDSVKLKLVTSPIVEQYMISRERTTATDGYFRVQIELVSGDFLELTEYFVRIRQGIETVDYRYQWMDSTKTHLRRRWDNSPHHPEVSTYPHHLHLGREDHVIAGQSLNMNQVLDVIEALIIQSDREQK